MADIPEHAKAGLAVMNADKPLAKIPAAFILDKYESGQSIVEIAEELGVSNQAVYRHLLTHYGPEWRVYQSARAMADLDEQKKNMKDAADGLGVTRARELAGLAKWELERLAKQMYGQETTQINVAGDGIKIELVSFGGDAAKAETP